MSVSRWAAIAMACFVIACNDEDLIDGGNAGRAAIEVTPAVLEFRTPVGTSKSHTVEIENVGFAPLELWNFRVDPQGWVWAVTPPGVTVLAPGDTVTLGVEFAPTAGGAANGTLTITSNDPDRTNAVVPLDGWGQPVHMDQHVQTLTYFPADVLLVIDNSGSMSDEQGKLSNAMSSFINWVVSQSIDFHLGVVTTDNGNLTGSTKWVEASTPNLQSTFLANANVGDFGSGTEMGMYYGLAAVTSPIATSYNAGFLRPDAVLHVVYLSDEEDQSGGSVASYQSSFAAVKADPSLVMHTAISEPGSRYEQLALATGGFIGSIYDSSYSPVLQSLALEITSTAAEFPLAFPADPSTIEVYVNGVVQPQSVWTYIPGLSVVRFLSNVPVPGDTVEIFYAEP